VNLSVQLAGSQLRPDPSRGHLAKRGSSVELIGISIGKWTTQRRSSLALVDGQNSFMANWVSTDAGRHLRGRRRGNTRPEMDLRRALHALGARFRVHRTIDRACTPDIVLPGRRIAVFVDGDYWHSCPVHGRQRPFDGPNAELWEQKMERNKQRDLRSTAVAEAAGWTVVRVWECSIRADPAGTANAVLNGVCSPPAP
jgi:DNA mismatch endonuclease, patch repair protein